jgi:uncharacterized protein YjbI with pentapeptide repeats
MTISSEIEFIEYLKAERKILTNANDITVFEVTIEGLGFTYFHLSRFKFIGCIFSNCHFDSFEFNGIDFKNVSFAGCFFQNVIVMDCSLLDCKFERPFSNTLLFGMTSFENVEFNDVEFQFTTFSDCRFDNVIFNQGWFHIGKFETGDYTYMFKSRLIFKTISLSSVTFDNLDLTETVFKDSGTGINLVNCNISCTTFIENKSKGVSSVDFFTLLKSEPLPEDVLKSVFGITNKSIKEILAQLTTEPNFHSVFISYSFKDADVGKELKRLLLKNGVKTFLWESDAPGGRKLKKIMIDGIREYEKFLFIASVHSLKSEACHYEISEARAKYYELWSDIFVPIHIDNYLFKVRKEDIPKKLSQTYWENIEELKEVHSLDFTFATNKDEIESNIQFEKLLNALKLKKDGHLK